MLRPSLRMKKQNESTPPLRVGVGVGMGVGWGPRGTLIFLHT